MAIYFNSSNHNFNFEMDANEFAYNLLLPEKELWSLIKEYANESVDIDDLIQIISNRYCVGLHVTSVWVDKIMQEHGFYMIKNIKPILNKRALQRK